MPRTLDDSFSHISELDHVVVHAPIAEFSTSAPSELQMAIGQNIAELVPDGTTLQLGIGSIPSAALASLTGHRDLGTHSEVISDGHMRYAPTKPQLMACVTDHALGLALGVTSRLTRAYYL